MARSFGAAPAPAVMLIATNTVAVILMSLILNPPHEERRRPPSSLLRSVNMADKIEVFPILAVHQMHYCKL
jgi:hypothetical protein